MEIPLRLINDIAIKAKRQQFQEAPGIAVLSMLHLYHNPYNFLVGFPHSFSPQSSDIPKGSLHAFGDDPIAVKELLSLHVHIVT